MTVFPWNQRTKCYNMAIRSRDLRPVCLLRQGKGMFDMRGSNKFDLNRSRQRLISKVTALLVLGMLLTGTGCVQAKNNEAADGILYNNEALGFSMRIPGAWKDRYLIKESENGVAVYNKKISEKYEEAGRLFTIERVTGELITEADIQQAAIGQQIVLQGNGYTYVLTMPSDVQYPTDDEEMSREYKAMSDQISTISDSMAIRGDKKPQPANEGFKVVGSIFFTAEIPDDWVIKEREGFPPGWDIYVGDNYAGWFALIPYKQETPEIKSYDNNALRAYLFNETTSREIGIVLSSEYADQTTMEKIKASLKFADGPFNVTDLLYMAEQYIAGGGQKIFGKIKEFDRGNGDPSIQLQVMDFILDGPGDENPNGFHIEDLHQTAAYGLDSGVIVVPLVAPGYATYGVYEMPLLDEDFIKKHENYRDFYYDFIIGSDGQLKIVLGHYVP